jgi:hypothetical protein
MPADADGPIRRPHEWGVKTTDRDGRESIHGILFDVSERHEAERLRVEHEKARLPTDVETSLDCAIAEALANVDRYALDFNRPAGSGTRLRVPVAAADA